MIVNGFWHGEQIDELSLFCINSWIKNGYEFHLWTFNKDISVKNATIKDARVLTPSSSYFTYDRGHSAGSPVAFSNYFRAVLLYELGGLYVDLDMLCIKPYNFTQEYVFCKQQHSAYPLSIGTGIIYTNRNKNRIFKEWRDSILEKRKNPITHGDLGPDLFTRLIVKNKLLHYTLSKEYFNPVDWEDPDKMFEKKLDTFGIHLYCSQWKKEDYSKIGILKKLYGY